MNWRTLNSLRWPIYVINSVDKAKLPCDAPHWRSPAVSLPIHQKFTQLTHHFHFFFLKTDKMGEGKGGEDNKLTWCLRTHKNSPQEFFRNFFSMWWAQYFANISLIPHDWLFPYHATLRTCLTVFPANECLRNWNVMSVQEWLRCMWST